MKSAPLIGKLKLGRVGEKPVGRGEGGVRRGRFGFGLGEGQGITRRVAPDGEEQRPQAIERRRRWDPVEADQRRCSGVQPIGFGGGGRGGAEPLRIFRDRVGKRRQRRMASATNARSASIAMRRPSRRV